MTRASAKTRASQALMRAGHLHVVMAVVTAPLLAVDFSTGGKIPGLSWVLVPVCAVWVVTQHADYWYHSRRLCERCAASAPLDPQAAARRWRFALRYCHSAWQMAVLLLAGSGVLLLLALPRGAPGWLSYWAAAGMAGNGLHVAFGRQHSRLLPWCPWCDWGGEDWQEEVPAGTPDPATSA